VSAMDNKESIMSRKKVYIMPNVSTPNRPVIFNPEICKGCNKCMEVCPMDVFVPNYEEGKSPVILHPEECWYCGSCVNECPFPGAISSNWPLMQRASWKSKVTGERFHV
jgi:NAD-dependent dihydropyrimidine dehydrogenase PreA subunit